MKTRKFETSADGIISEVKKFTEGTVIYSKDEFQWFLNAVNDRTPKIGFEVEEWDSEEAHRLFAEEEKMDGINAINQLDELEMLVEKQEDYYAGAKTAQEWEEEGYHFVWVGIQGPFEIELMSDYYIVDDATKRPLLICQTFDSDVDGAGLIPATARDLYDKKEGLEDVIRGMKRFKESQPCHKFDEDFALIAKIFSTTIEVIETLVDEYELDEETR